MKLLIFKTDIETKKKIKSIKPLLNSLSTIINWSIDTEDVDNVLRIETTENLHENDIIDLVKTNGFYCETLAD
ncbi:MULTISPECIES: hypothetical protein [Aquimarina]|uniref:Copper chaperone n=1 Tax=Aquimarina algiphila TaxID=2047982 RepID=A0A554VRV2_9FLAO|nr:MULTISPECIES: hypothetical protein [Aquimarina]TSE11358.1 hypothetical protein FOF46_01635 [Aquimarina algiphila]